MLYLLNAMIVHISDEYKIASQLFQHVNFATRPGVGNFANEEQNYCVGDSDSISNNIGP